MADRSTGSTTGPTIPSPPGRVVLLVEQYVERAIGIAAYVYILQEGDVVFVGEPSQCASGVGLARYLGVSA